MQISRATPMPQTERLELIGRLLIDPSLPLRARVAGSIVLLYAQSLSRVVRFTLDDITRAEQQTLLRLGEPPSPVPEPLAELLLRWIDSRDNMNTATNHACRWLFPGRRAGQPLHPDVLAALLDDLGIPTTAGRTAAIRQHVLEMPVPVSRRLWATTGSPRPSRLPRPEAPGADTPPETTGGHHQAGPREEPGNLIDWWS
ncbi:hypothetical protein OG936_40120 (plasmid) [Streptomyces sp. NBC_00846]|uniref:hypothetical protein n=1 Tax=Streptomyces sp. NBC_00846 TaxID=2975849 RepID=UPI00386E7922|nr:hypothetical protein OG936_40120 [Streptomyces sp. NBC_00846]